MFRRRSDCRDASHASHAQVHFSRMTCKLAANLGKPKTHMISTCSCIVPCCTRFCHKYFQGHHFVVCSFVSGLAKWYALECCARRPEAAKQTGGVLNLHPSLAVFGPTVSVEM